jgi:hypothetical protein
LSSLNNKFTIQQLTPVVLDLINQDQRDVVFKMLELYYKRAQTIQDFDTLGHLSLKSDHRELYLKCAEAAYIKAETAEQLYIARSNLYKAYNVMNQPEKALFYVDLNLSITPDDFETLTQRAFNIALAGDRKTSEDILLKLREKYPEKTKDMKSALSGKMLRDGNTAEGILAFIESTKPSSFRFDEILKMKRWTGSIHPGKTLYVDGEGGIGDEIINIRFFQHVKDLGMKPILYSAWSKYREDTVSLFQRNGVEVITDTYSIDTSQLWVPMMSLPGTLNLDESKLWKGPYLTPLRQEKNRLESTRFKIGIKCSGNPYFAQDEYRKIPLEKMLEYLPENTDIYYIDKETNHPGTTDLGDRIDTWEDTLDFIDQMDCIVSSCTSLVHAAGAMGKTTFVIVPIAEYYIWSTSRKDTSSPWYGTNFQVHKQTKVRSWDEPLNNVRTQLLKLMECK